ncbi:DMT family transporter [Collinsella sp. D33t1_170424_A12]|uniref:DMT family transporter n=1 Tax=Collinsella sp. D33t1_170424_A12 TaxID=2787135 RepID=UPI001897BB1E|nr:DMT family transporter [Collinsella sp. D33t1_170424_A12]
MEDDRPDARESAREPRTVEEVRALKKAHPGGTWKYACACRSGVRYEGESEAWSSLKEMIETEARGSKTANAHDVEAEWTSLVDETRDSVPVPPEDRAPGALRGAGARSPLFWKLMLVAMALIWGYSFLTMKTVLDTIPTYMLLACRFLPSAAIMFAIFHKRIRAHFNLEYLGIGLLMGCVIWSAYGTQTLGLVDTTPGKNAFLTGTYCILVPFIAFILFRERITKWHISAAVLCLVGVGFVALDDFSIGRGDLLTLVGAGFFALDMAVVGHVGRTRDVSVLTFWMFLFVGTFSLITTAFFEPAVPAAMWTPGTIGQLAFLAVMCTTVGLLLQNQALSHVPPATGSLLLSLESPFGVLFSVLVAGEVLTGKLILGFALIFLSIVLSETHFSFLAKWLPERKRA